MGDSDHFDEGRPHEHCCSCFRIHCDYEACLQVYCPDCSIRLHPCKLEDHQGICRSAISNCPNAYYGCKARMRRERQAAHLVVCPASVLHCSEVWNRCFLSDSAKRKFKRIAKRIDPNLPTTLPPSDEELDVHLALKDQRLLEKSYRSSRASRVRQREGRNRTHPVLPLRFYEWPETYDDADSSDEEKTEKARDMAKKKSPFAGCYLCKLEPGSQHLHVLGNAVPPELMQELELAGTSASSDIVLPEFYCGRALFIDNRPDHVGAKVDYPWLVRELFSFACDAVVRRDELAAHIAYHADLQQQVEGGIVQRCPLWHYGCEFVTAQIKPSFGRLRYNSFLGYVVHQPSSEVVAASEDMSQSIILCVRLLVPYLDSADLNCLAATQRAIRDAVFDFSQSKALVTMVWGKEAASKDEKESTGRKHQWIHSGYRLSFSPVQRITYKWNVEPLGAISNHLRECPFNTPFMHAANRINLRDMHGADVEFIHDGIRPSDLVAAKFQTKNDS